MNHGFVDDSTVTEVLDDDALQQLRSHVSVPHAFRVHDGNRPATADAEAWRLAPLDAVRPEEQSFSLEQDGQERVEHTTRPIGRAEASRTHEHVSRVRLHGNE